MLLNHQQRCTSLSWNSLLWSNSFRLHIMLCLQRLLVVSQQILLLEYRKYALSKYQPIPSTNLKLCLHKVLLKLIVANQNLSTHSEMCVKRLFITLWMKLIFWYFVDNRCYEEQFPSPKPIGCSCLRGVPANMPIWACATLCCVTWCVPQSGPMLRLVFKDVNGYLSDLWLGHMLVKMYPL